MNETGEPLRHERIWTCKIGAQQGQLKDEHFRSAVIQAYQELTGMEPDFIFSGWDGVLTEPERAVVEDRLPEPSTGEPLLDRLDALLPEGDWFDFGLAAEEPGPLWECDDLTKRVAIGLFEVYPELRRLVLQYREERDQWKQRADVPDYIVLELAKVVDERDALVGALKAIAYPRRGYNGDCSGCGHPIDVHAEDSRDAGCSWKDVELYPGSTFECVCRELRPELIARAALEEARGNDQAE